MSLDRVWLRLPDGGLVRADQAIGIEVHRTPETLGKRSHWLLDVVLAVPSGGGGSEDGWRTGPLYRTLAQTDDEEPVEAPAALARLLAQLDDVDAAGVVRADTGRLGRDPHPDRTVAAGPIRFAYTAFAPVASDGVPIGLPEAGEAQRIGAGVVDGD
ncbi:hypothetical protein H7X46_10705 [Pseudonocardia sp. C8]|uniref:hypothetical protein n=1 Tax=Pseudonocardia sp. C8 TaxID=2762759 RepID=UPI001642C709|nr:hypothetical protein [Pseudonocardia sp. C8]MBC3191532.1 hypothetical protein [Pseudonocardia sp. C8]